MKTCPHCSRTYPDDDLFCHGDGNSLVNEEGEQPTLINQKRIVMSSAGAQSDSGSSVFCPACGLENRADSKFCKGCAAGIAGAGGSAQSARDPEFSFPQARSPGSGPAPAYNDTVAFTPQVFTPPESRNEPRPLNNNKGLIAGLAGACIVLVVLLFALFGLGGGGGQKNNNTNTAKTPEPKPTLQKSFNYVYSGSYTNTNKDISLKLTLNRDGDKMTGTAETGVAGTAAKTDTLDGTIDENGDFKLDGKENGVNYTGIYTGHIDTGDRINGQWTPKNRGKSSTFTVSRSGK